jgi:anion-transporting  ArsA/GET3 family ATPase
VEENKHVIIETNGENVNGIITWYMEGKKQPYQICPEYDAALPCKSKQKPIDLKTEFKEKEYNKTVCFLKRDVCPTINSLQDRALKDVCKFIDEPQAPVPRLPEIDNDSLQRKMKGINETYTTLKKDLKKYGLNNVRVFYNPEKTEQTEQTEQTNGIIELTGDDITGNIYPDLKITCSRGGRKTKRRKTKLRRKTKRRRKTKARRR